MRPRERVSDLTMSCVQPLFLNAVSLGSSLRKEEDNIGFSLQHGEVTVGLDALSVNDLTLWKSKITEAISTNSAIEKKFLSKQKSGNTNLPFGGSQTQFPPYSVHENETKESKGRLLLIIVKGEKIDDPNGRKQPLITSFRMLFRNLYLFFISFFKSEPLVLIFYLLYQTLISHILIFFLIS